MHFVYGRLPPSIKDRNKKKSQRWKLGIISVGLGAAVAERGVPFWQMWGVQDLGFWREREGPCLLRSPRLLWKVAFSLSERHQDESYYGMLWWSVFWTTTTKKSKEWRGEKRKEKKKITLRAIWLCFAVLLIQDLTTITTQCDTRHTAQEEKRWFYARMFFLAYSTSPVWPTSWCNRSENIWSGWHTKKQVVEQEVVAWEYTQTEHSIKAEKNTGRGL